MKRTVRVVVFSVAILAVLTLVFGGGYLLVRKIGSGPLIDWNSLPSSEGGIEKTLIGLYLQFRQEELETPLNPEGAPVAFVVRQGETAGEIAANLEQAGLVSDAALFRWLVRYYDLGSRLEAGEYQLSPSMSMVEIAERLQDGRLQETTITIPEGWRLEEIAAYLSAKGIADEVEFLVLARSGDFDFDFLRDLPPGAPLEGYLFPDTYRIGPSFGARDVVTLMLSNFGTRFTPEMRARADALGMSIHEVLTLASIVEREAVIPDERPVIAAVYLNRLEAVMYLGADPTLQYALGLDQDTGKWWRTLTLEDYQSVDSPYNTYTHLGLPPGPICNPGLASMQAVLYPADVDYLYFLRNDLAGDGSHVFSHTFEEHLANQAKYRR